MNQKLQYIMEIIQQSEKLDAEQKNKLLKAVRDADKELEITAFKLERTEKVKKTTSILLEETIEELEQKRKAVETQNRELEIETALERVRSRTMGMQKSEELKEVIQLVYEQFVSLNINIEHTGFIMDYKARDDMHIWLADSHEVPSEVTIPYFDSAHWNSFNEAKEKGMDFFANHLHLEEKNRFYQKLFKYIPGVPEETKEYYLSCPGLAISTVLLENVGLYIENFSGIPYSDEENKTLMRFGKVFQQTYTRFNDLKQAEAQAREAQIEAALEKVRSRTMAMQKADELAETAYVLYEQFGLLGENPEQLTIGIIDETHKMWEFWLTLGGNQINHVFKASIDEPIVLNKSYIAWKERKKSIVIDISGDELKAYYNFFKNLPGYKEFNDFKNNQKPEYRRVINIAFFPNGSLSLSSLEPKPAETIQLLERFASVLEQTYTRFLDLQKAEAQTREAQIEAALERVRSKTMAMHNSDDVGITVVTLFDEVLKLGLDNSIRCGIGILDRETDHMETWSATSDSDGEVDLKMGLLDMTIHPMLIGLKKAWKSGERCYSYDYIGEDVIRYYTALNSEPEYPFHIELDKLPENEYHNSFFFTEGILFAFAPNPISEEAAKVLNRFASVFGQTYRRYLDLQKAEAQAREAQIESALERVRAGAMAMHGSDDLTSAVAIVFKELDHIEFSAVRCGIGIFNDKSKKVNVWTASESSKSETAHLSGDEVLEDHPLLDGIYDAWQNQHDYSYVLEGKDLLAYYNVAADSNLPVSGPELNSENVTQFYHCVMFPAGGLFAFKESTFSDEDKLLMRRFADVFHLTFLRHLDLLQAEAQAREAQIEVSLERVRARTMAMHKSNELAGTASHLFLQLNELGIKPYRCNIAIVDSESHKCQLWSTTNHGNVIPTATSIPLEEYSVFQEMYDGWKSKKSDHVIKLSGQQRVNWTEYITKYVPFNEYKSKKNMNETVLKENAIFSNSYFKQGFFVIHTTEELSQADLKIIQRFAHVFEQTYTRFLDLRNAELQNKIIQAENERKSQELEEARQLQLAMLPKELPQVQNLDIAVYMQTATEVGGDYYDFNVEEDGTLTAVIGDATGHGMKAGTIVTITKSLFNSLAAEPNILETFKKVSQVIKNMKFRQLSMCLLMMKIEGSQMSLSSAAMPPALIYRKSKKRVEDINSNGMPLGAMVNFPYRIIETQIKSGDTIFLMSDGFPELMNNKNEMYGYDKVKSDFLSVSEKEPEQIVNHLKNLASQWANGNDPDDDVTFVVIKIK